jgi:hypothetical protein
MGLTQLALQLLNPTAQPGGLALQRVDRRPARWLAQRLQRAPVALLAPFGQQRGGQALASQQRALALTVQGLVLGQDLGLVPGRVAAGRLARSGTSGSGISSLIASACDTATRFLMVVMPEGSFPPSQLNELVLRPASPEADTEGTTIGRHGGHGAVSSLA